jgi:hypothetical protein
MAGAKPAFKFNELVKRNSKLILTIAVGLLLALGMAEFQHA